MMVLRHIRPTPATTTVVSHEEHDEDNEESIPIDLSNKHVPSNEVPRNLTNRSPFLSHPRNASTSRSVHDIHSRLCRTLGGASSDVRWRDGSQLHLRRTDEDNSIEDENFSLENDPRRQNFIPLSRIQARYHQRHDEPLLVDESHDTTTAHASPKSDSSPPDQILTKRARLDCLISHIKQSKPLDRSEQNSDDTSSGEHRTNYDEGSTDLRDSPRGLPPITILGMDRFRIHTSEEDEEPCNLACPKPPHSHNSLPEPTEFEGWRNKLPPKGLPPLSPEAVKMYGTDPETYQQQMMLTSAAMMGDTGGLLKAMQTYPPWVYLNYYSQIIQSFQAQEILRQYALQSTNPTPTVSQEEKSASVPRTLGSSGYNCQSPLSPASLSEGQMGMDSDGGSVGQMTPGSANGKRAPRAMTGRHVRTGTGASPSTLQTLRLKIEERQRLKAQQMRSGIMSHSNSKGRTANTSHINNNNNNVTKVLKKSKK